MDKRKLRMAQNGLKILRALASGPLSYAEIKRKADLASHAAVSNHCEILINGGLVVKKKAPYQKFPEFAVTPPGERARTLSASQFFQKYYDGHTRL